MAKKSAEINPKTSIRLKQLLEAEGITAKELARRADTTPNTISKIMQGKAPLSQAIARGIANAFPGTREAYLMGLDDYKTASDETLYPVAKELTGNRSRTKAVDYLLASLGVFINPNEEKYPIFPEAGRQLETKIDGDKYLELVGKIYDASIRPDAFIIRRDGETAGYCNEASRKALYDEIIDFAEFLISKLCREEDTQNGNNSKA